jgi:hypothetical protein
MVELDKSLEKRQPWPKIAEILRKRMDKEPALKNLTIVLRAMTANEKAIVKADLDGEIDADGGSAADHDVRHLEFVFDVEDVVPPRILRRLENWVDVVIVDRVDQYLELLEGEQQSRLGGDEDY